MEFTCDNCDGSCSTVLEDTTLIWISSGDERKFRWGVGCPCDIKRRQNYTGPTAGGYAQNKDLEGPDRWDFTPDELRN